MNIMTGFRVFTFIHWNAPTVEGIGFMLWMYLMNLKKMQPVLIKTCFVPNKMQIVQY